MQVNPAIVIAAGPLAEEITRRAQELILRSTRREAVPAIFQFVTVGGEVADVDGAVAAAYRAATDKGAALSAEQPGALSVNPSRVESFVIAPLDAAHYGVAAEAARALRRCSRGAVSGGRNALFLLPRRTTPQAFAALQAVALALDSDVQSELTFNRCFFIDDVDESGQSIGEGDVVELVARFISLAVASELSREIRSVPPPYIGVGPTHRAYASFSCSTLGFDSQRLIGMLSDYLAADICRRLFADDGIKAGEAEWSDGVGDWLEKSLKEELIGPPNAELKDLNHDDDYNRVRERMTEFTYGAWRSLSNSLRAYQGFLDHCLSRGVVRLEALSKEMKGHKKEISETEIKILLGLADKVPSGEQLVTERYLVWALILGGTGLLTVLTLLFLSDFHPQDGYIAGITVGALMALAGIALAFYKKEYYKEIPGRPGLPLEEQLRGLKTKYGQKNKRRNIHVALLRNLDLAYANLEHLRKTVTEPEPRRERSIFDVDIINAELARKFYDQEYKTRDDAVASFTGGKEVYQAAFSQLTVKLTDSMKRYCNDCFKQIRNYDLEQMFRLRESLSSYRELQTASSPFWYPRDPAESEKLLLASIPAQSPEGVRALLKSTFGAQNVKYVHSRDPYKATLVQIAYGQRLNNILGHPPSKTNQHEKV